MISYHDKSSVVMNVLLTPQRDRHVLAIKVSKAKALQYVGTCLGLGILVQSMYQCCSTSGDTRLQRYHDLLNGSAAIDRRITSKLQAYSS